MGKLIKILLNLLQNNQAWLKINKITKQRRKLEKTIISDIKKVLLS